MKEQTDKLEQLLGKREVAEGEVFLDRPYDFGYQCPICDNIDLQWSEYNACVWCDTCKLDMPSCITQPDIDQAINVFIETMEELIKR